ncbi:hypothetical protein Tco_0061266, partial [Tanacetum coccineum]
YNTTTVYTHSDDGLLTNPNRLETQLANLTTSVNQVTQLLQALEARRNNGEGTSQKRENLGNQNDQKGCNGSVSGSLRVHMNDDDESLGKGIRGNGGISDGENDAYKMFDKMLSNKFGIVREYYDAFIPFSRKVGWSGMCVVSSSFRGFNYQLEQGCGNNVGYNSVVVDVSDCLKNKGIKIVTTTEKNDVNKEIGNGISVANKVDKIEQKREIGN